MPHDLPVTCEQERLCILWPHENSEQQRLPFDPGFHNRRRRGREFSQLHVSCLKLLARGGTAPSAYNSLAKASLMAVPNLNICDQPY